MAAAGVARAVGAVAAVGYGVGTVTAFGLFITAVTVRDRRRPVACDVYRAGKLAAEWPHTFAWLVQSS